MGTSTVSGLDSKVVTRSIWDRAFGECAKAPADDEMRIIKPTVWVFPSEDWGGDGVRLAMCRALRDAGARVVAPPGQFDEGLGIGWDVLIMCGPSDASTRYKCEQYGRTHVVTIRGALVWVRDEFDRRRKEAACEKTPPTVHLVGLSPDGMVERLRCYIVEKPPLIGESLRSVNILHLANCLSIKLTGSAHVGAHECYGHWWGYRNAESGVLIDRVRVMLWAKENTPTSFDEQFHPDEIPVLIGELLRRMRANA